MRIRVGGEEITQLVVNLRHGDAGDDGGQQRCEESDHTGGDDRAPGRQNSVHVPAPTLFAFS